MTLFNNRVCQSSTLFTSALRPSFFTLIEFLSSCSQNHLGVTSSLSSASLSLLTSVLFFFTKLFGCYLCVVSFCRVSLNSPDSQTSCYFLEKSHYTPPQVSLGYLRLVHLFPSTVSWLPFLPSVSLCSILYHHQKHQLTCYPGRHLEGLIETEPVLAEAQVITDGTLTSSKALEKILKERMLMQTLHARFDLEDSDEDAEN